VKIIVFFVAASLFAIAALANTGSPYAGEETREIKDLR
jgi:hypothetical protein